jgi:tetratricopeptide (TPR) repeat protein
MHASSRFIAGWLSVLCLGGAAYELRARASAQHASGQTYEDIYYLPPVPLLPVLTAGYGSAVADLIWIRLLLYFGEEMIERSQTRYLYNYVDSLLALDADFKAPYGWIAMAALYHAGEVTAADGYRAVEYLERAVARWPDDGELAWDLGATLRFELPPLVSDPAEKAALHERAVEHLATAARLGAGPAWLASLNVQLLEKLGKSEQAIRHLEEMYASVQDPSEKQQLEWRLMRLRSEAYAEAFRSYNEDFRRNHFASRPYASANLFALTGAPIADARHAQLERGFRPEELDLDEADGDDESEPSAVDDDSQDEPGPAAPQEG